MRTMLIAVGAYLTIMGPCFAQAPTATKLIETHIAPQRFRSALKEFAESGHTHVLYLTTGVKGLRTPRASGYSTSDEELRQLLSESRLRYRSVITHAVSILPSTVDRVETSHNARDKSSDRSRLRSRDDSKSFPGSFRLAQVRQYPAQTHTKRPSETSNSSGLTTIVVTAQRYASQAAYDVPIALTVLNDKQLFGLGVTDLASLQFFAPGLFINGENGLLRHIFIGGVENTNGNGALVSEYFDDADVTASPSLFAFNTMDVRTYDMNRVEVLHGPQGTLYGEASEGGAIHFVTNQPEKNKYDVGVVGEADFTAGGQPSQTIYPIINVPLSHHAAIRLSGEYGHDGGWIDEPQLKLNGINYSNLSSTRLQALWQPFRRLKFNLMQIVQDKDYGLNNGEGPDGNFQVAFPGDLAPPHASEYLSVSNLRVEYVIPFLGTLVSSSTYSKQDNIIYNAPKVVVAGVNGQLNVPVSHTLWPLQPYRYHHHSEELRLHNKIGSLQYTVGAFYKLAVNSDYLGPGQSAVAFRPRPGASITDAELYDESALLSDPLLIPIRFSTQTQSKSWSGFLDVSYDIAGVLTIDLGAREFTDTQQSKQSGESSATFHSTDPQLSITYKLPWRMNAYLTARKGFRSGGFNGFGLPKFSPEYVWWYEGGLKTRNLSTLSASIEFHYARYANYQDFGEAIIGYTPAGTPIGLSSTFNGGIVKIRGGTAQFEWRPQWRLFRGVTLSANGDYENSRFAEVSLQNAAQIAGDPTDLTPRYMVTLSAQRDFRLAGRPAFVRVDYSQRARLTDRFRELGVYEQSDYLYLMNLNTGMQWNDHLGFGIRVQNLLDDRAYLDPFIVDEVAARERPLTVGFYIDCHD